MPLKDLYGAAERPVISFELFPPKTPAGEKALWGHVERLMEFEPAYLTCTYGAGGSTQQRTLDIVGRFKKEWRIPVASHLTCVGSTRDQLRSFLSEASRREIDYIVALRGDPPRGDDEFRPVPGGLAHANELVALIRREFPSFGIAVAGYPEKHVEAPSLEVDIEHLRRKVDEGADIVLTQLFYDNVDFFRFVERCRAAGIVVPIVPGILPITSFSQIERITSLCGARLPDRLVRKFEAARDSAEEQRIGVEHATEQVRGLLEAGVPGIHFYVLNKSGATSDVLRAVGTSGYSESRGG